MRELSVFTVRWSGYIENDFHDARVCASTAEEAIAKVRKAWLANIIQSVMLESGTVWA